MIFAAIWVNHVKKRVCRSNLSESQGHMYNVNLNQLQFNSIKCEV